LNGSGIVSKYAATTIEDNIYTIDQDVLNQLYENGVTPDKPKYNDELKKVHSDLSTVLKYVVKDERIQKAVAWVILGHSDIKLENERTFDTLNRDLFLYADVQKEDRNGNMRLRELSAYLRWADELDCSSSRITGITNKPADDISKKYWDKLELVETVNIGVGTVTLVLNEALIATNRPYYLQLLKEVVDKLNRELLNVAKTINEMEHVQFNQSIVIEWKNRSFKSQYDKIVERSADKDKKTKTINILSLIEDIHAHIESNGLFYEGHYLLHSAKGRQNSIRTRNKLDCSGILTSHKLLDRISQAFINYLYSNSFDCLPDELGDNYLLIGIANSGVIISSHIGFIINQPIAYVIPEDKSTRFTEWEKSIKTIKDKIIEDRSVKPVLIVGTNNTGETILNICNTIKSDTKVSVHKVIGLINRENVGNGEETLEVSLSKIGVLSKFLISGYTIEICKNDPETCVYKFHLKGN
jgi:hypothetical protein